MPSSLARKPLAPPRRQVGGLREGQDPSEEFPVALPGRGREGRVPAISTVPPGSRLTALRQHHAGAPRRAARRPPPPPQLLPARRGRAAAVAVGSGRDARAEPQRPPGLQGGADSAALQQLLRGVPQAAAGSAAGAEGYRQGRRGDGRRGRGEELPSGLRDAERSVSRLPHAAAARGARQPHTAPKRCGRAVSVLKSSPGIPVASDWDLYERSTPTGTRFTHQRDSFRSNLT